MRLYMILLSTLPIYMCFILGLFLQNAKTGYPSNCHMLLSLFLRYRAAYKRIILCTAIRISQHHRDFRTSCASMSMNILKLFHSLHVINLQWVSLEMVLLRKPVSLKVLFVLSFTNIVVTNIKIIKILYQCNLRNTNWSIKFA